MECVSFEEPDFIPGDRNKRAREAVTNLGPAVLNGCVSTFLSIVLLANSNSMVFQTFFKVCNCRFRGIIMCTLYRTHFRYFSL